MKSNVYIDGFNLYYRCLRGTPYKWLDVSALCRIVFPKHEIHRIRYFTARVQATAGDPQKPHRQDILFRALRTLPQLSIHFGHFTSHPRTMPLASSLPGRPQMVEVIRTEEKGSDVNLATYLLVDGFQGDYEVAIVVSNDSDLVEPIRMVQEILGLAVGILNPQRNPRKSSVQLRNVATFYRAIRPTHLQLSQFPTTLQDANGTFTKPAVW